MYVNTNLNYYFILLSRFRYDKFFAMEILTFSVEKLKKNRWKCSIDANNPYKNILNVISEMNLIINWITMRSSSFNVFN